MTTTSSTGVPLPGQHFGGPQQEAVDPDALRAEVAELLSGLSVDAPIGQRARILEQAHDVLVHALGTVDKI